MRYTVRDWLVSIVLAIVLLGASFAFGREGPQWAQLGDPDTRAWYARQKMPDNPRMSCCGEADAYYADRVEVVDGYVYAVITDTRDDAPLGRPHIKPGTKVYVPPEKNKDTRADPNPTGHTVIFVRWYDNVGGDGDFATLCYLPDGGF